MKTTDTTLRLFAEEWNLLSHAEKVAALDLCSRWGRADAARGEEPPFGWTNRLAEVIRERTGEETWRRWQEVCVADSLADAGDGLDPREVQFSATAAATLLRSHRRPRAAARGLLRRSGQRTVNTRARRALATA